MCKKTDNEFMLPYIKLGHYKGQTISIIGSFNYPTLMHDRQSNIKIH